MTTEPSLKLSEFSANGSQSNNLPTKILKQLRSGDTEEKIIQSIVEVVYQTLKCDRVVVYSMQSESFCKVTAEAVTPGYAQILGRVIRDVCFEEGYIEKYQKGRVRSISDINKSTMADCHLESLRQIDVKANLVVPLVNPDNSLYGLLVIHQCSKTRQWRQSEVEFVLEMAYWTTEQLSRQKAHTSLAAQLEQNDVSQKLIAGITQEIHRAITSKAVLQLGVDKAQDILNCDRVVVYCLQDQSMGEIIAEATIPSLSPILNSVIKDPCFEYRYIDQYQQGRIRSIDNIHEAGMTNCYVENLAKIGVRSNLVAPINWDNGKLYGLLVAHQCFNFKEWQPSEIEYFKEIAFHTGLSLSKAKLSEESQAIKMQFNQLESIRDFIQLAQTKIQQIRQPVQNASEILIEANNLNKLLDREINLINQNSSPQTKKDIKMMQIMVRKLALITSNLRAPLFSINNSKKEADSILEKTITNIVNCEKDDNF